VGRRSRKRYRRVVKVVRKPPSRFQCPTCGLMTLSVEIDRDSGTAVVSCSNPSCGLRASLTGIPKIYQEVDVYAKFIDKFTEGSIEVTYSRGEVVEGEMEG